MNAQRMPIQETFLKRIDRPIAGVIKGGQDNKKQELEEYKATAKKAAPAEARGGRVS